jgi:hypothetical protein
LGLTEPNGKLTFSVGLPFGSVFKTPPIPNKALSTTPVRVIYHSLKDHMASKISKISCLLLMAAGMGLVSCVADAPPRVELAPGTVIPEKMGLVFWVDGLDIEAFGSLQKAGKLPNITKYLNRRK